MSSPPEELPDPVIMRIIRRFLQLASSIRTAVSPLPLLNAGAKRPRRSPSPAQRATSFDANNASTSNEIDLDAKANGVDSAAELHGAARPTGLAARRRRQRQRRRAAPDPDAKNAAADEERSVELEAATKNAALGKERFAELDLDAKVKNRADSNPPSKNSWPSELDLDGKADGVEPSEEVHGAARPTGLAARRRRQRQRRRAAPDPDAKNAAADEERSVELEAATKNAALGKERFAELDLDAKVKNRADSNPPSKNSWPSELDLDGKADGVEPSAEVHAAAPPTGLAARRRQRQRVAAEHRPPAAAIVVRQYPAASAGPLDDLEGVESFFDGLFDEPDEDEDRVRHLRYKDACSSLKKTQTYCLACSLSDDNRKHPPMANDFGKVTKHMNSAHKGGWIKCPQKGCYAMATNVRDINLHHYYAHEM